MQLLNVLVLTLKLWKFNSTSLWNKLWQDIYEAVPSGVVKIRGVEFNSHSFCVDVCSLKKTYLCYPFCNVSSNQSNMRRSDKAGAPHWQCSSAPSSVVNNMYFFEHIRASNTFFGCPG